jgi:hypothetical protein
MPVQDHLPSSHSSQYSADSTCGHCDGIIRHEPWCITQNASVQYAYQAVSGREFRPSCATNKMVGKSNIK